VDATAAGWTIEQVVAVAPGPSAVAAAERLADPARWASVGSDERCLWGRCRGSGPEPYDTVVDHAEVGWRCTCPSRKQPCKHALALLVMWVRGRVPAATAPAGVARWAAGRTRPSAGTDGGAAVTEPAPRPGPPEPAPRPDAPDPDRARDERVAAMLAGLVELDRWLDDRLRTGLADPALARYATWDDLAARLVDARAGALANRVRRLAGLVGAGPQWHAEVLAEIGVLHLLARAGQRVPELPGSLADAVATAAGWQVRTADVLAGVPDTDTWVVAGRSDVREDRIEVRRVWLRGLASRRWAMVLSFAAYRQSLDASLTVGTAVRADLHRYPGGALRALVGRRHTGTADIGTDRGIGTDPDIGLDVGGGSVPAVVVPPATTIAGACDEIGVAVAAEPWLDRHPATVVAAPGVHDGHWVLGDHTGALPLLGEPDAVATLLAASRGAPVTTTVEWTPRGVVPLTVHLPDRAIDLGPRADPSFVGAA
jgi:hypothetical protein